MPKSKLVLIITSTYPFGAGEEFFEAEVRGWIASGLNLIILPLRPRGILRREASDLKYLTINPYRISVFVFFRTFFNSILQETRSAGGIRPNLIERCFKESIAAAYAPELSKITTELKISHIHAYWASGPAMLAMTTSRLTGINWSFTGHSGDLVEGVGLNKKTDSCEGIRLISERGKWFFTEKVDTTKVPEIIHLGVEVPTIEVLQNKFSFFKIACVGNLIPIKRHITLIQAIKLVQAQVDTFKLDIIGSGPLENDLKRNVVSNNLENSISFRGQVHHADLMAEYAQNAYQLVVLASGIAESGQQEGIPVSLMEAMSYGIPVISTESGGIPELIPKELDLLVQQDDPQALADKILKIVCMPFGDRNELATKCRSQIIENFNITRTSREFEKWLNSLIN